MDKHDIEIALQGAVRDYNIWNSKQTVFVNYMCNDRRGIFYNKLVTKLKTVRGFFEANADLYGRLLEPEDLRPYFTINGHMGKLEIVMYARGRYMTGTKHDFLVMLESLSSALVYNLIKDDHLFKLASIVEQIKAFKL